MPLLSENQFLWEVGCTCYQDTNKMAFHILKPYDLNALFRLVLHFTDGNTETRKGSIIYVKKKKV